MPRIRTLKPEFFTSEDIVSLSPLARLFFQACWCESDREGRMTWKPGTMKLRYFPADKCDIEKIADEVVSAGLVVVYEVEGKRYAHIPTFKRHQYVNPKESASVLPEPTPQNLTRDDASLTRDDASNLDLTGVLFPSSIPIIKEAPKNSENKFSEWWAVYPRREGKADAQKAYEKAIKRADHETLMAGAKRVADNPPAEAKFIPMPATWLNGDRWLDEKPARNQEAAGTTQASAPDHVTQWRARLRSYKPRGFWPDTWGNRPEVGNPLIPPDVYADWRDGKLSGAA